MSFDQFGVGGSITGCIDSDSSRRGSSRNVVLPGEGEKDMRLRNCRFASMLVALMLILAAIPCLAGAQNSPNNAHITELYKMQAAFHRYATVHDPVLGDSPEVIAQRIRDMLSLWTSNAVLSVQGFNTFDGYYIGNGDPEDASSCPEVSGVTGAYRGTLCTYFKWIAGSFQAPNKFIVLTPSYLTSFDISGDTATGYWECHYYDVSTSPWTAKVKIQTSSSFQRVKGHWLFSSINATPAGIPIP
jgi:hypothetical protein